MKTNDDGENDRWKMSDTTHTRGSRGTAPAKQRTEWYAVSLLQSKHHLPFGSTKTLNEKRGKTTMQQPCTCTPHFSIDARDSLAGSEAAKRLFRHQADENCVFCFFPFLHLLVFLSVSCAVIEVQAHALQNNGRPCRLWQFGFRLRHKVNA